MTPSPFGLVSVSVRGSVVVMPSPRSDLDARAVADLAAAQASTEATMFW